MHVTEIIHWIIDVVKVMGGVGGMVYFFKFLLQVFLLTDSEAKKCLENAKNCFKNKSFEKALDLCDGIIKK